MYRVHVCEWNATKFVARNDENRAPRVQPVFEDAGAAQEWCDAINARIALDIRKNAALEWALAHGIGDDEISAALDGDQGGLLEFEKRMPGGK